MACSLVSFVAPLKSSLSCRSTLLSKAVATRVQPLLSPTSLLMRPDQLADYTGIAIQFFTSIRIPSALIAGASLSSLFSLVQLVDDIGDRKNKSKYRPITFLLARVYHGLCLTSLILSLNVIVTSTSAATTLMLENHNSMAYNAYEFMNREFRYEFITTRWSFLTCLLSFIASIATRSLLEFDLLRRGRRRLALIVVFSMSALLTHLLSYVNSTLYCWPNLGAMTLDVFLTIVRNAFNRTEKNPLELLSLIFGAAAAFVATPLFRFEKDTEDPLDVVDTPDPENKDPGLQDGYVSEEG